MALYFRISVCAFCAFFRPISGPHRSSRPSFARATIPRAALQRDLAARDQVTPILFQLKALVRTLEDTHTALGVDLYIGTRALYRAVKPIAVINGVQDITRRIGQRFARQGRTKTEPVEASLNSSGL